MNVIRVTQTKFPSFSSMCTWSGSSIQSAAALSASTPLPDTENDKKKSNQETIIQEVPGNCICSFRKPHLNAVAISPISLKDAAVG